MMGRMSRTKGSVAEREFAALVRSHGFECERTGRNGKTSEDVTHNIAGDHYEVKRRETLSVSAWLTQAEKDAAEKGLRPVVAFRRSREPWRVIVDANEYLRLKALERDELLAPGRAADAAVLLAWSRSLDVLKAHWDV